MNATKKESKPKLMPDNYIRLNGFIIYTLPDNYVLADVQVYKTGNYIGQEYSINERYYSSLENVIVAMGEEVAHKFFPDFVKISKEINELRDIVKKGLHINDIYHE